MKQYSSTNQTMNRFIAGAVLTLVIGGTAYTINQADVVKHFAADTGLSQEQAEQYVSSVKDDDLVSYTELGDDYIDEGNDVLRIAHDINCSQYQYDWESPSLTCYIGKNQITKMGNDEIALGKAYKILDGDSAGTTEIQNTINLIDAYNKDFDLAVAKAVFSYSEIDEIKKNNSFNKALLKSALEGD